MIRRDDETERGDGTQRTVGASQPSLPREFPGERRGAAGGPGRGGVQAVIRHGMRRDDAGAEGGRVPVSSAPDATRTFARKTVRFFVMSAAIVAVSLLTALLFNALVPNENFSTSYLPHLAAWMGGAFVGLAAGIAALYKAGTHR